MNKHKVTSLGLIIISALTLGPLQAASAHPHQGNHSGRHQHQTHHHQHQQQHHESKRQRHIDHITTKGEIKTLHDAGKITADALRIGNNDSKHAENKLMHDTGSLIKHSIGTAAKIAHAENGGHHHNH